MTDTNHSETNQYAPALTVLYDGACPLCRREIGVYRDLQPRSPARPCALPM
jgi:predicted DCC family thiol-disulfide oxidoreductase YuxK